VASATSLVEVPAGEWDDLLVRLGVADAYLRRAYLDASAVIDPGTPVLLHLASDGGDVVLPVIVRDLPDGDGCDLITPYGYGGAVAVGDRPPLDDFWSGFDDWCAARNVVTTFFRYHPLLETQRFAHPRSTTVDLTGVVSWNIEPERELLEGMHRHHRRVARKAERSEVVVTPEFAPADLTEFIELYELTMRRQDAAGFYFFTREYWEALQGLGEDLVVFSARRGDELLAAALCIVSQPALHYHLGATSDAARELGAFNLCLLEVARWGQANGCTRLVLGGGIGGGTDSLLEFKQRFDPESPLAPFAIGKLVNDAARYRELTGADSTDGFFPGYRSAPQ
jgi:hypothetical protein